MFVLIYSIKRNSLLARLYTDDVIKGRTVVVKKSTQLFGIQSFDISNAQNNYKSSC